MNCQLACCILYNCGCGHEKPYIVRRISIPVDFILIKREMNELQNDEKLIANYTANLIEAIQSNPIYHMINRSLGLNHLHKICFTATYFAYE